MILSFVLLFPAHTRKSCRLRVSRTSCVLIFSYVNLSPYLITFGDGLRLHHASAMHDRIRSEKPNASFAVAWFLLLLFPAHTRKSCRLRVSRTSCVLIFSYVNLSPYLITFGDGLRLHHASAMHDRIRSEKPNASFAVAWFPLTPFPCHTRKSCRLRVSRTSCVLIFSYVNLSPYLITYGDGLRLHHASAMHDRVRSEKLL